MEKKFDTLALGLPDLQNFVNVYTAGIGAFFTILVSIEVGLRLAEWWETRASANPRPLFPKNGLVNFQSFALILVTTSTFGGLVTISLGFIAYNYSAWRVPLTWWTVPLYFLAGEFFHYFYHRLMHEVRLFWGDHSTHHSSTEFDYFTNWRQHLLQFIPKAITMPVLCLFGLHPLLVTLFGAGIVFQLFCHTARFGTWGWWDRIFMSPSNHGIHHSRNPVYMDRNYGGFTVIWDRLLGSHAAFAGERMVYGVTHAPNSTNLIVVLVNEYVYLWRDFFGAPKWKAKLQVLFGRPGETFEAPVAVKQPVSLAPANSNIPDAIAIPAE